MQQPNTRRSNTVLVTDIDKPLDDFWEKSGYFASRGEIVFSLCFG